MKRPLVVLLVLMALFGIVFLLQNRASLIIIYILGMGFVIGIITYFSVHRFNKNNPGNPKAPGRHNSAI